MYTIFSINRSISTTFNHQAPVIISHNHAFLWLGLMETMWLLKSVWLRQNTYIIRIIICCSVCCRCTLLCHTFHGIQKIIVFKNMEFGENIENGGNWERFRFSIYVCLSNFYFHPSGRMDSKRTGHQCLLMVTGYNFDQRIFHPSWL